MVEKSDKQKKAEELAQELFAGMKPEEMPSADTLLRALEIAKGAKVRLSPNAVKRFLEKLEKLTGEDVAEKLRLCGWPINDYVCNPCDWKDVCIQCDWEDVCIKCDWNDCLPGPGGTVDIDNPPSPK
jgi:hypothetical protein